jgi:hypothetical protein
MEISWTSRLKGTLQEEKGQNRKNGEVMYFTLLILLIDEGHFRPKVQS